MIHQEKYFNHCQEAFLKLRHFLMPYQNWWQNEVLMLYPLHQQHYPASWIDELIKLNLFELWQIEVLEHFDLLKNPDLKHFFESASNLEKSLAPATLELNDEHFPQAAWAHIKPKKRHEISRLYSLINQVAKDKKTFRILDIGGGVGHLSRFLCQQSGHQWSSICLDSNAQFIKLGQDRLKKEPCPGLHYLQAMWPLQHDRPQADLLLGLHSCGPLSCYQIQEFAQDQGHSHLINVACCYHHIENDEDKALSSLAQEKAIYFSPYALSLASRAHRDYDQKKFQQKFQVKKYRYALHLLLEELGHKDLISVGHQKDTSIYYQDFSSYAQSALMRLNLKDLTIPSQDFINHFFNRFETQKQILRLSMCNVIRWRLGRLLELCLLYDRACYLLEQGHQVQLTTLFDDKISPRNIALVASFIAKS